MNILGERLKGIRVLVVAVMLSLACASIAYWGGYHGTYGFRLFSAAIRVLWVCLTIQCACMLLSSTKRALIGVPCALTAFSITLLFVFISFSLDPFIYAFERRLKSRIDAQSVQDWAIKQLGGAEPGISYLNTPQIPGLIGTNEFLAPEGTVVVNVNDRTRQHVEIAWGNTMVGRWGLAIGHSNYVGDGSQFCPGVYFFVNSAFYGGRQTSVSPHY